MATPPDTPAPAPPSAARGRLHDWLKRANAAVLIAMMGAMVALVFGNVVARYVFNVSFIWAEELSQYLMVWVTFLGAAYAYGLNEHIGLDFVVDRIRSEKARTVIRLLGEICIGAVIFVIAWFGWDVAVSATNLSPALDIPMTFVYGVVPLTGALMVIGLAHGPAGPCSREQKQNLYGRRDAFMAAFAAANGSLACKGVLGHDLTDPQQRAVIREKKLFTTVCVPLICDTCALLEEYL